MKNKILMTLFLVGVSFLYIGQALAGACVVTTEKDNFSKTSTLRYIIEEITYNRESGGCWITKSYADKDVADQYVAFQTEETNPSDESAIVRTIVLTESEGALKFKPLDSMVLGNYSDAAIHDDSDDLSICSNSRADGENDDGACYDDENSGYITSGGDIKDYGFVVIDGRTNFAKKSEGDAWTDNLPIKCKSGASDVFLRNVILITNGYSESDIFNDDETKTSCFKNAGNVHVCSGTYKEGANPNTDSDWCDRDISIVPPDIGSIFDCDDEDKITWYADADADTFGDPNDSRTLCPWFTPVNRVQDNTDCDDTNAAINPAAQEICDGLDNDCDALVDDDDDSITGQGTYYTDADLDTFGDAASVVIACAQPTGAVTDNTDCNDADATAYPGAVEDCGDNGDNDCDTLVDCEDTDSCSTATECSSTGSTETLCDDGLDDDADGAIDCDDADCVADPACVTTTETICDDSLDNDGDGSVDCYDSDCTTDPVCAEAPGLEICDDLVDNDSDGLTDCSDDDCANDAVCASASAEVCTDLIDNDLDTLIDCYDTDCSADAVCVGQLGAEVCNDSFDNDSDGVTDCSDDDCLTSEFCTVDQAETECDNDLDDDEDGSFDCDDSDCTFDSACATPDEIPEPDCTNGDDDDGDGLEDCDDADCDGAVLSGDLVCTSLSISSVAAGGAMGGGGCACNLTAESAPISPLPIVLVWTGLFLVILVRRATRHGV